MLDIHVNKLLEIQFGGGTRMLLIREFAKDVVEMLLRIGVYRANGNFIVQDGLRLSECTYPWYQNWDLNSWFGMLFGCPCVQNDQNERVHFAWPATWPAKPQATKDPSKIIAK